MAERLLIVVNDAAFFLAHRLRVTLSASPARYGVHPAPAPCTGSQDRKSTRLNSSHLGNSYAVFCAKKKKQPPRERSLTALGTPMSATKRCSLIGRDRKVMEIRRQFLDTHTRVTVAGPGGVGRTRCG